MIGDLVKPILSAKAKATRDSIVLAALAYLVTQVGTLDKRLERIEMRLYGQSVGQGTNQIASLPPR